VEEMPRVDPKGNILRHGANVWGHPKIFNHSINICSIISEFEFWIVNQDKRIFFRCVVGFPALW
jgi:hypothetical protein